MKYKKGNEKNNERVSKAFNGYFEGIKDGMFLDRGLRNCEIKEYEI